jgi:glycosyltransferase involved in cell wall biosynthesis
MQPILYIVIPCYNEEKVLPITAPLFLQKLKDLIGQGKVAEKSRILFVNDGSKDATWELITSYAAQDAHYSGIAQSRNRGHQSALLAGLMEAKEHCDITISIDCDGQDDIGAMDAMVDAYLDGCEVVYGVRDRRDTDSFAKRFTAQTYYKILNWMGAEVVYNHSDYRLVSRRVLEEFSHYGEVNLFLRGMFPLVGFKSTCVYYDRKKRMAGESHYPLGKMLALAFDGITSLSVRPLHMITALGCGIAILSFIGVVWSVVVNLTGRAVTGWASMTSIICFIGGVQLICLGVLGEYIGKIYLEVKHRPRYIISERTDEKKEELEERA